MATMTFLSFLQTTTTTVPETQLIDNGIMVVVERQDGSYVDNATGQPVDLTVYTLDPNSQIVVNSPNPVSNSQVTASSQLPSLPPSPMDLNQTQQSVVSVISIPKLAASTNSAANVTNNNHNTTVGSNKTMDDNSENHMLYFLHPGKNKDTLLCIFNNNMLNLFSTFSIK